MSSPSPSAEACSSTPPALLPPPTASRTQRRSPTPHRKLQAYNATSEENFLSPGNDIARTAGFLTVTSTDNPGGHQYQFGVRFGFSP